MYYFQEYDAPKGYHIDETPMKFEIKEDGEVIACKMTNKKIKDASIPQTGDKNSIMLYGIGMLASGSLLLKMRRKKNKWKYMSVRYKLVSVFLYLFLGGR